MKNGLREEITKLVDAYRITLSTNLKTKEELDEEAEWALALLQFAAQMFATILDAIAQLDSSPQVTSTSDGKTSESGECPCTTSAPSDPG